MCVTEIWTEYKEDMEHGATECLEIGQFRKLMTDCFPHVKIRETKQVTGATTIIFYIHYKL